MLVAVIPACSKAARIIIERLLDINQSNSVRVRELYKNISCVPHEFRSDPNFKVTEGDVSDATAILEVSSDSDAILVIVTTQENGEFHGPDSLQSTKNISKHVRLAVQKKATAKCIVILSSMQMGQCKYGAMSFSLQKVFLAQAVIANK